MKAKSHYTPSIDGLRALAVLSVIINHLNEQWLPGGFLGVDIFFVISGFVITGSLLNRGQEDARSFFGGFYKRRIKRLLPALLFSFVLGALLISMVNPEPNQHLTTGLYSLIGFANVELYFNAIDYWGQDAKLNPFTHTWSLGVEEQFYLVFPLLIWLITAGQWEKRPIASAIKWLSVLTTLALLSFVLFYSQFPTATYFLMPFRFWEIGLGCLLYMAIHQKQINMNLINKVPTALPLVLIIPILFISKDNAVYSTVAVVVMTLILIWKLKSLEHHGSEYRGILTTTPVQYIGKISYSLYLWHWIIIVMAKWTWGIDALSIPVILFLMFFFASFSYHLIENPLRRASWKNASGPQTFLIGTGILCLFGLSQTITDAQNRLYLGQKETKNQAFQYTPKQPYLCESHRKDEAKPTFRTIGNSHANHIVPMLKTLGKHCGFNVAYSKHPNYIDIPNGKGLNEEAITQVISELTAGDVLVLSSRNRLLYQQPYLKSTGDEWFDHTDLKTKKGFGLEMWLKELDFLLKTTSQRGIEVVLILPTVEFDQKVVNYKQMCGLSWFKKEHSGCNPGVSKSFLNNRFPAAFYSQVSSRAENMTHFHIFNPEPFLCSEESDTCHRIVEGVVAYIDTNHLSKAGAHLLAAPFASFIIDNHLLPQSP